MFKYDFKKQYLHFSINNIYFPQKSVFSRFVVKAVRKAKIWGPLDMRRFTAHFSQCHKAILVAAAVSPLFIILGRGAWTSFLLLLPLSEELMSPPSPSHSDVICEGLSQQRTGERHSTAAESMVLLQSIILRFCLLGPVSCIRSSFNYDFRNIFLKTYPKVLTSTHPQHVVCMRAHTCMHTHHTNSCKCKPQNSTLWG